MQQGLRGSNAASDLMQDLGEPTQSGGEGPPASGEPPQAIEKQTPKPERSPEPAQPREPEKAAPEQKPAERQTIGVPDETGKLVQVDLETAQELAALGMRVGDPEQLQALEALDHLGNTDQDAAAALKLIVRRPDVAKQVLAQFEQPRGEGDGDPGSSSPQESALEKENRELRAKLAGQESGTGDQALQRDMAKFPALEGVPEPVVAQAVKGHMSSGKSRMAALQEVASAFSGAEGAAAKAKLDSHRSAEALSGLGGGEGGAPTGGDTERKFSAKDLRRGAIGKSLMQDFG